MVLVGAVGLGPPLDVGVGVEVSVDVGVGVEVFVDVGVGVEVPVDVGVGAAGARVRDRPRTQPTPIAIPSAPARSAASGGEAWRARRSSSTSETYWASRPTTRPLQPIRRCSCRRGRWP